MPRILKMILYDYSGWENFHVIFVVLSDPQLKVTELDIYTPKIASLNYNLIIVRYVLETINAFCIFYIYAIKKAFINVSLRFHVCCCSSSEHVFLIFCNNDCNCFKIAILF